MRRLRRPVKFVAILALESFALFVAVDALGIAGFFLVAVVSLVLVALIAGKPDSTDDRGFL